MTTQRASRSRASLPTVLLFALLALMLIGAGCHPVGTGGPSAPNHPIGVLDGVTGGNGTVRVTGWAADNWSSAGPPLSARTPATIVAVLNGQWVTRAFTAGGARPDVGAIFDSNPDFAAFRQTGHTYGFDFTLAAPPGPATVCVGAVNSAFPNMVMSLEDAIARGLHPSARADHSFIGCASTAVT